MFKFSVRFIKDIYLGSCFVILFSSFGILSSVQKTITASIEKEDPSSHIDGYISLGIVYTALSLGMWLSPAIITKTGPKYAMIIGASFYLSYIASFYTEKSHWIYLGAALCGCGGSLLWTGQANYVVLNSRIGKVYSTIGVFWILYQSSHFLGNFIIYTQFHDVHQSIDKPMRVRIISTTAAFALAGILMMFAIRPPLRAEEQSKIIRSPCNEIYKSAKMLVTSRMLLLVVTIVTLGIHMTFLSILSAAMSFSKYLSENSKELAPLCGAFQGIGEVLGGIISLLIGGTSILKMKPLITLGISSNLICYIISILSLPDASVQNYTDDLPIISLPNWSLVLAATLSGIGDACLHTEMYDVLGSLYPNDSASAFAVFKFLRSIATAGSFYYGKYVGLYIQVAILIVCSVLSWILYHCMQWFMANETTAIVEHETSDKSPSEVKCEPTSLHM